MVIIDPEQRIDIGDGNLSDVLVETIYDYRKVSLDISKIKKIMEVYEAYHIPESENLIAFCKGTIFFIGIVDAGVIFTDKAMYLHPSEEITQTRFLYTDFCKYVVVKQSDNGSEFIKKRAGLYIQDESAEYRIYEGTLFAKNSAAQELFDLITAIQRELAVKNPLAKKEMNQTIIRIFDSYETEMRSNSLNAQHKMLLEQFLDNPDYCEKAFALMAENAYRTSYFGRYEEYIDHMSSRISEAILIKAKEMELVFANHLISDLSNLQKDISSDYINKLRDRFAKDDSCVANTDLAIKALVSLRLSDYCTCAKCIELLKANGNQVLAEIPEILMFFSGSQKMQPILDKIISDTQLDESDLNVRDNIGFTPLHYAILFAEDPYIYSLLDQYEWYNDYDGNISKNGTYSIYNYSIIYYIRYGRVDSKVLEKTESSLVEMENTIKSLQQEADKCHAASQNLDKKISAIQRRLWEKQKQYDRGQCAYEDVEEQECLLSEIQQSRYDLADSLNQALDQKNECSTLYYQKRDELKKAVPTCANRASKNINPLVLFLKSIIKKSSEESVLPLEHMRLEDDMRLYRHGEISVLLPSTIALESSYRTINISHDGVIINGSMGNGSPLLDDINF